ncbi:MAG TPA: YfhO family protein [Rhodocyclaceae bacterium]|nr:YfhO family protein [Rhodocyclaceae bacterium]
MKLIPDTLRNMDQITCFGQWLLRGRYAFILIIVLVTWFWLPSLLDGKLIIHGDSGLHGLPLIWLHHQALTGQESLLWSSRIYGGHPMFAEGQGGFANPLNILSVWLFEPLYALGFLHWSTVLTAAIGVFCLCRVLGISRWSATFAGIATAFSGFWVPSVQNLPISTTLAWIPWQLAAAEHWLKQPSAARAALLAIPAALLVFAGYPQLTHGTIVYLLASLLVQPLQRDGRVFIARHWRALLKSGLLAIVLAIGLASIQLLPLFELAGLSHRSQGTAVIFDGFIAPAFYLKGLFYFYLGADPQGINMPNLANIAVLMLAGLILLFRVPVRILSHAVGAFLLFNLAIGSASPLFQLVYKFHLIPGLHFFRGMQMYFPLAVIGCTVVAAFMLDELSGKVFPVLRSIFSRNRRIAVLALAVYGGILIFCCYRYYAPIYTRLSLLAPVLMLAFYLLCAALGKRRWFPLLAVLILTLDVLLLRMHAIHFFDRKIVDQPAVVHAIATESDVQDYHVMDQSSALAIAFLDSMNPTVEANFRRLLKALGSFPAALQWQVPSINGQLALPLSRRVLLDPVLWAEVDGADRNRAGLRLIDILGIRYISRDAAIANIAPSLPLYVHDRENEVFIYRNTSARPRFQVYWDAISVDSPEQALAALRAAHSETLVLERLPGTNTLSSPVCATCGYPKPIIDIVEARAQRYRINVEVAHDAWLFLADANYPGWQATVNGVRQPVYSAQVLGKAVRLKAGRNVVELRYVPWSFYSGAVLSGITLLLILVILLRRPVANLRKRSQTAQ